MAPAGKTGMGGAGAPTGQARPARFIADEAHQRFLAAFKELYAANGMKGLSAAALSAKTGYSRSTFYRYFESVYDLLDAVESEATPYENMGYLVDHAEDVGMVEITNAFLAFFEQKEELIRMLTVHRDDNRYYDRMRQCLKPVFYTQAQRIYIMEPREYEVMAEYLTEAKLSLLKAWAASDIDMNLGHMTQVTDSVLEGGFWDRVQAALARGHGRHLGHLRDPASIESVPRGSVSRHSVRARFETRDSICARSKWQKACIGGMSRRFRVHNRHVSTRNRARTECLASNRARTESTDGEPRSSGRWPPRGQGQVPVTKA